MPLLRKEWVNKGPLTCCFSVPRFHTPVIIFWVEYWVDVGNVDNVDNVDVDNVGGILEEWWIFRSV